MAAGKFNDLLYMKVKFYTKKVKSKGVNIMESYFAVYFEAVVSLGVKHPKIKEVLLEKMVLDMVG